MIPLHYGQPSFSANRRVAGIPLRLATSPLSIFLRQPCAAITNGGEFGHRCTTQRPSSISIRFAISLAPIHRVASADIPLHTESVQSNPSFLQTFHGRYRPVPVEFVFVPVCRPFEQSTFAQCTAFCIRTVSSPVPLPSTVLHAK